MDHPLLPSYLVYYFPPLLCDFYWYLLLENLWRSETYSLVSLVYVYFYIRWSYLCVCVFWYECVHAKDSGRDSGAFQWIEMFLVSRLLDVIKNKNLNSHTKYSDRHIRLRTHNSSRIGRCFCWWCWSYLLGLNTAKTDFEWNYALFFIYFSIEWISVFLPAIMFILSFLSFYKMPWL